MPLSVETFRRELAACGLLTPQELEEVVSGLPVDRPVRTAADLARELVRLRKLTAYQAQEVMRGHGQRLVLGNYLILDKIGQGGMGLVLKAEHRRMRRIVALKVLRAWALASEAAVRRFHREVQAAARLIHPHIVTAFDADEDRGTHFLVMEYVEGTDLSTLVKLQGPLPLARALEYVLQAAAGLAHAHEHGIVHRDIKPRNLLLSREGIVKILDMGLARIETSTPADAGELTGSGQIMGTIDYMAPEQAVHPKEADERADIYSLGATLWYLVTGQHLYEGQTVLEKLIAHREQPIPRLSERVLGASPHLDTVFARMVAKKPQQRFATMREVIAALQGCRVPASTAATVLFDPPHEGWARPETGGRREAVAVGHDERAATPEAERELPTAGGATQGRHRPGRGSLEAVSRPACPEPARGDVPAQAEEVALSPREPGRVTEDEGAQAHVLDGESLGPRGPFLTADAGSRPLDPAAELETFVENPSASDTSRRGALIVPLVGASWPGTSAQPGASRRRMARGPKAAGAWPSGMWWWLVVLVLVLALALWLWLRGAGTPLRLPRSTAFLPPQDALALASLSRDRPASPEVPRRLAARGL